MNVNLFGMIFAAAGFSAVALGAFAAHGLKSRLAPELLAVFQTGVTYHFYHALAIGLVLALSRGMMDKTLSLSAGFFAAGILIFSGSLYALALSGLRWLGAVTPIGGLCFLAGWACAFVAFWRARNSFPQ